MTDLTKRLTKTTERFSRDRSLQIAERSIVSMHEYTNWIDSSRPKRWNVLILTVDALRADHCVSRRQA